MRSIAILGPGGVGGFLAAVLVRAGEEVTVVGREQEVELIARDGILVESVRFGQFSARPAAIAELTSPTDFLLVATKATGLSEALERVKVRPRLVVPLLNGVEHVATLRSRFGSSQVAAGVIRMEADCPAPGRVVHSSPSARVELAADDASLHNDLQELALILNQADIPTEIGASEAQVLWSKLVRLAPLACTTSVADRPIGFIRSDAHWRSVLAAAIAEVVAVANAEGAQIDPAVPVAELAAAHPTLGSSMQRDLTAGREPELDAIPGAVLRAGARHELQCPTIAGLAAAIAERAGIPAPRVPAARNPISADILNDAMESLGLADLRFEAVGGKPVLRRAYDDMSFEHFIGLLLTGIGAVHLQRVEVAKRLAELEDQVAGLTANEPNGVNRTAATEQIASSIAGLRQALTLPVVTQHQHQVVVPKLSIGPIEPSQDLD